MRRLYKVKSDAQVCRLVGELSKKDDEDAGESSDKNEVGYADLFCSARYSRATFLGILIACMQLLSGINLFMFYASELISSSVDMPAKTSVFLVYFVNFLATAVGLAFLSCFGRRSILIAGSAA